MLLVAVGLASLGGSQKKRKKRPRPSRQSHAPIPALSRPAVNRLPPASPTVDPLEKAYFRQPGRPDYGDARFELKRPTILTAREIECYRRLSASLSPHFLVFPQVAFSQILEARGGTDKQNLWLFRTMSQKVADFLICKSDLTMVAVIELDDRSHIGKEENDRRRDAVMRQIGLLPLRLPRTPQQEALDRYADILLRMFPVAPAETSRPEQVAGA